MGSDPREFSVWTKYKDNTFPWFAVGYEDDYLKMNDIERIINGINWIFEKRKFQINKLSKEKKKLILTIPFEHYIIEPEFYINKLSLFISRKPTSLVKNYLRKRRIPREFNFSEVQKQTDNIMNMIKSSSTRHVFVDLCSKYERILKENKVLK